MQEKGQKESTLCWNCSRSVGDDKCSWAFNFTPVEGWDAVPTHNKEFDSYIVRSCPEFVRDSYYRGTTRK